MPASRLQAYETLLQRYPDSRYAAEAQQPHAHPARPARGERDDRSGAIISATNNFLAAINRFRVVVTSYQTTEQVEEALMRLTEAYMALGIVNEAQTAAAVLGHNYPDSKWYGHAYDTLAEIRRAAARA